MNTLLEWPLARTAPVMPNSPLLQHIVERVDRLIAQHTELRTENTQLAQRLEHVTRERDALQSRLDAVRQRVDALLARLPRELAGAADAVSESATED